MKVRNPRHRYDLKIPRGFRVLEVGGGHNPHPRSNMVVDKYAGDRNLHRGLDLKVLDHQKFLEADGESLPFGNKEFDFVICNHVLEHVDHPELFLSEQVRVARAGYLETPSLIGEYLVPKTAHKWVILELDGKVVLYDKQKIGFSSPMDFGVLFNEYLPKHSMAFKMLQRTQPNLLTVNFEWKEDLPLLVNPENPAYLEIFSKPWEWATCDRVMVHPSLSREAGRNMSAFYDILQSVFRSKILGKRKN